MSEIKVNTISNNDGTEREDLCKAWINFNGSGTVVVRDSFNVTDITDNSNGNYTVTWDTDFANANYALTSWGARNNTGAFLTATGDSDANLTTSAVVIFMEESVPAAVDVELACVIVFGDQT